uniref:Cytochrome P450 family 2 subfamily D member 6 n=1 Tax=Mandrillus leucophaeus TaxID=9568 RepID=A0A2K5XEA0_MANLE
MGLDALVPLAVTVAIFLLLVDLMHRRQRWAARYPPSPLPLPGLGNLLHVDFKNTPYCFDQLRRRFGDVFSLQLAWTPVVVLNAVPLLLRIPALAGKVLRSQKAFLTQLDELLTEHRMTWDPAQPPRDLTDAFLAEMEKAKRNPESSFNEENLRMVVADLFSAGMVTTSTTLAWGLLLMILHPDVQRESSWGRVQQEIDDVIGQVRRPEMRDQAHMPYTTAVIHEVQRFGDIVPLNMPHMTSRDIEVQGFLIPKVGDDALHQPVIVLKDEAVWEKPFRFHPEHFLDAQGHFVKPEAFLPFSAGRRACLGEPLARMELFLFFTCLLQRFSFSVPAGQPRPTTPDPHLPPPGCPFRPNGLLDKAASNVIASLTCGCRFEYDDPRFLRLLNLAQEGLKEESGFLREVRSQGPQGLCRASS